MENTGSIIQDILDQRTEVRDINWYYQLLSLIDYTTLEGTDTNKKVIDMCSKAKLLYDQCGYSVAAICVYPNFIKIVKQELSNYPVKVASVAAAFPSGQTDISIKVAEVNYCVDAGADEVDIVISRGKLIEEKLPEVQNELLQLREASRTITLKTIIESGELETTMLISKASRLAIQCGSDFIKTSTGKAKIGATLLAHFTMMSEIKQHHHSTQKIIGMKPSGGIATPDDASAYIAVAKHFMGENYITNSTMRIGASSLLSNVINHISSINSKVKLA